MKAIFTRTSNAFVTANDGDGSTARVRRGSGADLEAEHAAAVQALCAKMGWTGRLVGGYVLQGGRTCARVWVWDDGRALRLHIPTEAEIAQGRDNALREAGDCIDHSKPAWPLKPCANMGTGPQPKHLQQPGCIEE